MDLVTVHVLEVGLFPPLIVEAGMSLCAEPGSLRLGLSFPTRLIRSRDSFCGGIGGGLRAWFESGGASKAEL